MHNRQNVHIAVADDDESVCRSFGRLLRVAGLNPVSYASAEALLEDTKRPRFDCLVLDIQLEGMSGLKLMRRLAAGRGFSANLRGDIGGFGAGSDLTWQAYPFLSWQFAKWGSVQGRDFFPENY